MSIQLRRQLLDTAVKALFLIFTVIAVFFLTWILWSTLDKGVHALRWDLFIKDTPPPGVDGYGMRNAFVGSLILMLIALAIGIPVGVMAGTWLAEYGFHGRAANAVRFLNDIMLSAPSIEIGLFVYAIMVDPMGHFSGLAGGVALAILMIPIIVRTTDEMLALVATDMREAAIALGAPTWLVITKVTWRAARAGILTGILVASARIVGETAPLLFTALNNQFFSMDIFHPLANLPVVIFQFAMSPYSNWQQMAWAAALMTVLFVLVMSVLARFIIRDVNRR